MSSQLQCFLIERTDKPNVWWCRDVDGTKRFVDIDDPARQQGSPVYRRLDTGEEVVGAPPGAMFYYEDIMPEADMTHFSNPAGGPDGKHLIVVLPDGHWWHIDSIAQNASKPWDRSGVPPNVTARPSILTDTYHGFLTDGVLVEC
jgi:hypothetical protein